MTVVELIQKLSVLPPNANVYCETSPGSSDLEDITVSIYNAIDGADNNNDKFGFAVISISEA